MREPAREGFLGRGRRERRCERRGGEARLMAKVRMEAPKGRAVARMSMSGLEVRIWDREGGEEWRRGRAARR